MVGTPHTNFPSFWEGLSLRPTATLLKLLATLKFPFLLGKAFIEAVTAHTAPKPQHSFPFLSGGGFH